MKMRLYLKLYLNNKLQIFSLGCLPVLKQRFWKSKKMNYDNDHELKGPISVKIATSLSLATPASASS